MTRYRDAASVVEQSPRSDSPLTYDEGEFGTTRPVGGRSVRPTADEVRTQLVLDGYFPHAQAPYGTRAVHLQVKHAKTGRMARRTRLEPGPPDEIEIVRLIFELYACQKIPVNHILNVLRAEKVPTTSSRTDRWSLRKVDRILCNPVYIGAAEYKGLVRSGAFTPIVEPWLFHAAQSRRYFEKLSKSGSLVGENNTGQHRGGTDV